MTNTTAKTYAARQADAEGFRQSFPGPTVTITMTEDEAKATLEALAEPCLQKRAFVGLTDAPFRQYLVEVSDALKEVLPNWHCDECDQTIVSNGHQSTQHASNCSLHPDNEVKR
jgi:hypothetical protein